MKFAFGLASAALACAGVARTAHAESRHYNIPAGALGEAVIRFGDEAGINIGLTDPVLAAQRTQGVHGRHSLSGALHILLKDTGAEYREVAPHTVRIITALPRPARIVERRFPEASKQPSIPTSTADIVVTASKNQTLLSQFPGSVSIIRLHAASGDGTAQKGTSALVQQLPILSATGLGSGRDKLFIRGIADSSFNGTTQSTVAQYWGDARLTYNAPDPNLLPYDVRQVEVIEGPQGTLYGNGAIGGIIRVVPNAPDFGRLGGTVEGRVSTTQHSGLSNDVAGTLNVPLGDALAMRATAYRVLDAGYIDDPVRGLTGINRDVTMGARLTARWHPDARWTIDVGGILQNIDSADGNYVLQGSPDLTRSSRIAQPFGNKYLLGFVTATRTGTSDTLTSTTSIVRHSILSNYDATDYNAPTVQPEVFQKDEEITELAHETRLFGNSETHPWVIGLSGLYDIDRVTRALGSPTALTPLTGLRNQVGELALFGEYGATITPSLHLSFGGRVTASRALGILTGVPSANAMEIARTQVRVSPSATLRWDARPKVTLYARVAQGARAGGLAIVPSGTGYAGQEFEDDSLLSAELGARYGRETSDPFWLNAALSFTRWSSIQADLLQANGLPYTTNIGDGYVNGFEMRGGWSPLLHLTLSGAVFLNRSALYAPTATFSSARGVSLPNIAKAGVYARLGYTIPLSVESKVSIDVTSRYVGPSHLGIVEPFDPAQGNYLTDSARIRLNWGRYGASVSVENLSNVRSNQFAFGNPFGINSENQVTPLRPRTIRFGLDGRF